MKTTRLITNIISMVLFAIIMLQSCAAGVVNSIDKNGSLSGTAGVILAFSMLIGGIVGIATRKHIGGILTSGFFYFFSALLAFAYVGDFSDLAIWATVSLIFSAIQFIGYIVINHSEENQFMQKVNVTLSILIIVATIAISTVGIHNAWY